jgi:phosphoserine phosphatase RsbU/P
MLAGMAEREELDAQLRGIATLAGAYLGQLGTDDVLREITRLVADMLTADTATVLLRDVDPDMLAARAAFGIEEEVRQGVRVPVGKGFAGTVAASAEPLILERVDESTVENPLLWEKGIRTLLGVPIVDGASVVGVLHVGSLTPRRFSEEEVQTLALVADQVALAVRNRGSEVERVTAQVLQRSLLPARLPDVPGVEFATRYVPAEEGGVGGDWYDAFLLPDGHLWVMVGDVAGHGLMPAVIMGRLRSALRSYALAGHGPDEVLALADRKLQFFEAGSIATVLSAVLPPSRAEVHFASAGHLPPVLARPAEPAQVVDVPVTPPLGVGGERIARVATVDFPPGTTLLACTDGLVERRGESLDEGLGRLARAVRADHPETVCKVVMDALVGRGIPRDDVAVLALRRRPGAGH